MWTDVRAPNALGESLIERPEAVALLAVFVTLLVMVPLVAAQPVGATSESPTEFDDERGDDVSSLANQNETTTNATRPPENVTYTVVVYPTAERVIVRAEYTTNSSAEAERAENGTLNTAWFDGDERVQAAFSKREDDDELIQSSNLTSRAVFPDAESTDVVLKIEFEWRGVFAPEEEREVIGPQIAAAFRPGDRLAVEVFEWKPETVNTEVEPTSYPRNVRYDWTIGEGDEPPRIVFNRSVVSEDDGESATGVPLGPAAGGLLTLAALTFALLVCGRRTSE